MRMVVAMVATWWAGCAPDHRAGDPTVPADGCVGLECKIVDCAKTGRPVTTVSGTVYAPNGTLALYGVSVYVPVRYPDAFPDDGARCTRCEPLSGGVVAKAISDEAGRFTLTDVPAGDDIPVVVTIGKWRRVVTIPTVAACTDNPLPATATRLPASRSEGEIPKIAVATGSCDALECLIRKLGIAIQEFTPGTGSGRIQLYASNGAAKLADDTPLPPASALWSNLDTLRRYDLVLYSCECGQLANDKPQAMMDALKAYADGGGRVFLSHYHNIWIAGETGNPDHAPQVWPLIATCDGDGDESGDDVIDQVHNPKGAAFARWMVEVDGSPSPGIIPVSDGRQTCTAVDHARAERWVYWSDGATDYPQNFQFTTPNEAADDLRCGKVVFSDMHVASGSTSKPTTGFPGGCATTPLTPQEKALAFMFFDIAACVGPIL